MNKYTFIKLENNKIFCVDSYGLSSMGIYSNQESLVEYRPGEFRFRYSYIDPDFSDECMVSDYSPKLNVIEKKTCSIDELPKDWLDNLEEPEDLYWLDDYNKGGKCYKKVKILENNY